MTLEFNISGLALTVAEGGSYSFTLTPKGPLSAAMDIRWVIVPKGKIPITKNDFSALEGTESFASGATAGKIITITPTDDALAEVSGEFEIQVYQVVSGGDILIGSQDVVLTDDEASSGTLLNRLPGNSNVNNFFLGSSSPLKSEGGNGDDVYVISRYQTGDVTLSDGFDSNTIKFDYGVEIASVVRGGFFGEGDAELTLGTGGVVTWKFPNLDTNWKYQIGDGDALDWTEFLTAIGLSGSTGTLSTPYTVDSLATDSVTAGNIASRLSGTGADEVFSLGVDGYLKSEGGNGDDVYIITRYQKGDVTLSDGFGANILKFDYGVEIASVIRGGFFGEGDAELTLGTGGIVTWKFPNLDTNWQYQIADGAVLTWTEFLTALGLGSSGGTLSTPYTVEDPPGKIITSDATGAALPENTEVSTSTAVYTAVGASDAGAIVWTLKAGADAGLFNINSSTGVVTFIAATTPDHEDKSSYSFTIIATAGTETDELLVTIAVTDLNDTSPVFTSATTATLTEGTAFSTTTAVYTATATPDVDGDTIVWSLSSDDADLFNIDSTGKVTFATATTPDFESGRTSYRFNVIATVGTGSTAQTATQAVTLSVTNVNEAPIISTNGGSALSLNVLEGTTIQTPIAKIVASDGDGDTLSYSLSGADAADFSIDANGLIKFVASPSFASPADSGTNNVYDIVVTVSDGTGAGALSDTIALAITILESTESTTEPTISSGATGSFAENTPFDVTTPIYTAAGSGSAGAAISWSLKVEGGTAASYTTRDGSFYLTFTAFTAGAVGNDLNIAFVNTGGTGSNVDITYDSSTKTLTITHGNNATASDFITVASGAASGVIAPLLTVGFGGSLTTALRDLSGGALTGGADGDHALFNIDPLTGKVTFKAATTPDFETDPSYSFTIVATTGTLSTEQAVAISITDAEDPPVLAGDLSGEVKEAGVESAEAATFFNAHGLIFTFKDIDDVSGDDKGRLGNILNGTLKNFQFLNVGTSSSTFTSIIGDVWTFRINTESFSHTYSGLMGWLSGGEYGINDFYTLSLADGITGADDLPAATWQNKIALSLEEILGGPIDTPGTPMATGQLSVTDDDVSDAGGFAATDLTLQTRADSGSAWETATSSTDSANGGKGLKIVGTYGALYLKSDGAWSYELDNDDADTQALTPADAVPETFELRVTDGTAAPSAIKILTITVQGTNDSALSASASGVTTTNGVGAISVAENTQTGNVTTITVTNPDGTPLSYSLLGVDASLFTFDEATSTLRFKEIPDFEFPTDDGKNNIYNVTVHITDGVFSDDIVLEVTVTDVGTLIVPTITSGAGGSIKENLQYTTNDFIYVAEGTTGSHERILWSLKAGDNAALFDIDPRTGVVTFKTATTLDYESNPFIGSTANDGTPEFRFTIVGTVGNGVLAQSREKNIIIKLENLNDAPEITTNSGNAIARSVAENTASTAILTTIVVDEEDVRTNLRYGLSGADADDFTINAQGQLRFKATPNAEAPTDSDADNIYDVTITVQDDVDASGNALDSDSRRFSYDGGVATITDTAAVGHTPAARTLGVTSGSIIKSDGTIYNFAAQTGLSVTADSYIIVDDADNNNSYEVRLVSKTSGLPSGNDFYVLGEVEPHTVSNNAGGTRTGTLTINPILSDTIDVTATVTDVYDLPPVFTSSSTGVALTENVVITTSTAIYTATATPDIASDTIAWSLKSGGDAALFDIDPRTGKVTFKTATAPDYEGQASYSFTVIATTRTGSEERSTEQAVTINVNDVNEAPVISSGSTGSALTENVPIATSTAVYQAIGVSNLANNAIIWSLSGADAALFNINANTGAVTFKTATTPDAESKPNYQFTVIATTGTGATEKTDQQSVAIAVLNVEERPVLAGDLSGTVTETGIEVSADREEKVFIHHGLVFTLKDDASESVKTTLANFDHFSLVASSSTQTNIDSFSGGTNNLWKIVIDPVGSNYNALIDAIIEHGVTYNIIAGFDVSLVSGISGTAVPTGIFERVSFALTTQKATIPIEGVATATGQLSVTDDDPTDVGGFAASDLTLQVRVGSVWTAANTDGANENKGLKIVGTYGAFYLKSNGAWVYELDNDDPDTELLTPSDNAAETFELRVTDGTDAPSATKTLTITVQGSNDNISFSASASGGTTANGVTAISVAENANTKAVTTITATNPSGLSLTYSLQGADKDLFTFDQNTGVLSFKTLPDFESPTDVGRNNVYEVFVKIVGSDGTLSSNFALAVKVSITNVYDSPPIFTSSSTGAALPENVLADGVVYTAAAKPDIASDTIHYSLKAGVGDVALFDINSGTGAVAFKTAPTPDFESGKTSYSFTVIATTRLGTDPQSAERAVTISVADRIELPTITTNDGNALAIDVAEGGTAVTTIAVADVEAGETLAYRLSGADAALFSINASGVLRFKSAPDFGTPSDVGGDNVYDVTVHVTDGVSYDASGDSTDADTRFFEYTGGTLTRKSNGKLDVADGEITTQDGRTIDIHAALNLALPEGAYVIAHDMNGNGFYTSRVVTQLPTDTEAYYVLGKEDAFDAYASVTVNGVVIVADQVGAAGNDIEIKFLKTAYSQPTIFATADGFLVYFSSGGESVSLSEIINAINANSNSRDLVTASLAVDGTGDDEFATIGTNTIVNLAGGSDAFVQPTGDEIDIAVTVTDVL